MDYYYCRGLPRMDRMMRKLHKDIPDPLRGRRIDFNEDPTTGTVEAVIMAEGTNNHCLTIYFIKE